PPAGEGEAGEVNKGRSDEGSSLGCDAHQVLSGSSCPVRRRYASRYRVVVACTTSGGRDGAGASPFQRPASRSAASQSRRGCLSKLGGVRPGTQPLAGQNREESGVSASSI